VSADLILHWTLDETSGAVANDSSGNGRNGTVDGTPDWVAGQVRGALDMDGASDGITLEEIIVEGTSTVAMWMMPRNLPYGSDYRSIFHNRTWTNGDVHGHLRANTSLINFDINGGGGLTATTVCESDEWYHALCTFDLSTSETNLYVNGVLEATGSGLTTNVHIGPLTYGAWNSNRYFDGIFDDIRVYDHAVTAEEVPAIMAGSAVELAADPSPADEQIDVPRAVILEWGSGKYASTHDVYFGSTLDDVNDASRADPSDILVSQGQSDNTYDVGILDFGQTYYWRVDEVNSAPDRTVFKGAVWSFTAEPFSIPVETITATASSSHSADMGPDNTVGGVGLNELDQHSTDGTTMWLSGMGDVGPSIQYEFDKAYKLHEMLVWNSNQAIESFVGIGAKDVVVEYSLDGIEWAILEGATQFAQATGNETYTANTVVDFGGALAQFVKITVNAGYGMLPQYGISEVRFMYIPTFAREPQPAEGDTTAGANVVLGWRAGREAASHEIYLGTDAGNLALAGTVNDTSYAANALDYDTTYYWQVVEVNNAETPAAYAGDVWSFVTPPFGTVDDFDQYDDDCDRIFFSWEDGLGHSGGEEIEGCDVPASNGNGGGSIVGNNVAPFAEKTIVNVGSSQSLPFEYDNSFGLSEATLRLGGQDWTTSGVQTLALAFSGTAGNSGSLYVKINNTKVVYDGAQADIAQSAWQAWNIDLSAVSGLQSVTSLAIGVDGGNAAGMLYIDDIRLYPKAGEFITPVMPDDANLTVYLPLDGNSQDASGNNRHGTVVSAPQFVPGAKGQALQFDGADDYVNIDGFKGITAIDGVQQPFSISNWFRLTETTGDHEMVTWGASPGTQRLTWRVHEGRLRTEHGSGNLRGNTYVNDGEWHFGALTVTEGANLRPDVTKLYVDGLEDTTFSGSDNAYNLQADADVCIGCRADNKSRFFPGSIDEVRIYDRALSPGEIAGLAGKTEAIHKPF